MYVYEAGCIDWWHGMTRLVDFINLCPSVIDNDLCEDDSFYPSHISLKLFLKESFINLILMDTCWELNIRNDDCIGIGAIHFTPDNGPGKLLTLKQNNNGSSFIVSECMIYTVDGIDLITNKKDLNKYDPDRLICDLNFIDQLIESIFWRALNKPKIEEKNNILEVAKECISRDESKKEEFEGIKLSDFN